MRADILNTTLVLAQALDVNSVAGLSGSEADLTSPIYQRLKQEMERSCRAWDQCRFLYVAGRRPDGTIFFYVDSEPSDSPDYSPPGDLFEEASPAFRQVFMDGKDVIEGPSSDRWGTWVSALTAVPDEQGKPIAVFGMDIDARAWNRTIASRFIEPILVAMLMLAVTLLFFYIQQRTEQERRRLAASEAAIRESELQYRRIIETIPDIFCRLSADGTIQLVNPAAARLLGYASMEEMVGQPTNIIWANPHEVRALFEVLSLGSSVQHWEFLGRRKDGSLLVIEASAYMLYDEAGKPAGFEGIGRDITERKMVEETLRQAKEAAESANHAKSAFLAAMSHEIRTPLNGVLGMTSLLLDTEMSGEQREYAEAIRVSTDALLAIINEVLDFSKIEAGRLDLELQPFDLRECIESALDLVATQAAAKSLDLIYLVDDDVPEVVVSDVTRLRQILLNLLSNAVKFTDTGEIILRVRRAAAPAETPPSRCEILFTVQDTGIGIPLERMDRLFKSFSQVDASTTRKYGGTGLGLAISKRLSELLGGRMWVESEVGKGSVFSFTIAVEIAPGRPAAQEAPDPNALRGKRVLIVDDSAANRRILSLQIAAWGMTPRDTDSPRQTLDWLTRGEDFDVALLDMQMPEMDGLTLAQEIRRIEARSGRQLPLVLLTSLGRREARAQAVGLAGHLTKPVKPTQLRRLLLEICAGQQRAPAAPMPRLGRLADQLPLHILIAEDHPVNQKLATQILAKMGYRADVVGNGLEAVQALERQAYDVILMDVQMPEMDGLDATREIRRRLQEAGRAQPRIIAMTANALAGDREACLAAGMNDYISKPIRVEELVDALYQYTPRPAHLAVAPTLDADVETVDWDVIHELRALGESGTPDFAQEMIALYVEQTPALLDKIRAAVAAGNGRALQGGAHALKGNSRTLGLLRMAALSVRLEEVAGVGDMAKAAVVFTALEREFEHAKEALRRPPAR